MKRQRWISRPLLLVLFALPTLSSMSAVAEVRSSFTDRADLAPGTVRSGSEFLTESTRKLQEDSFANPGLLWVDRGQELFEANTGNASCRSCHEGSLAGVFARYPAYDAQLGKLLNIEGRINRCRTTQQGLPPLNYESEALLSLTAYVASLARGMSYQVSIDGPARAHFDRGRNYFFERRGQMNLACSQCHDDNWGRMLRGDRISQGHGNAYPGYRMEWQSFGSLHRRIQDCDTGVKAAPHALGSTTYVGLELYLAWRAANLTLESPGVRR